MKSKLVIFLTFLLLTFFISCKKGITDWPVEVHPVTFDLNKTTLPFGDTLQVLIHVQNMAISKIAVYFGDNDSAIINSPARNWEGTIKHTYDSAKDYHISLLYFEGNGVKSEERIINVTSRLFNLNLKTGMHWDYIYNYYYGNARDYPNTLKTQTGTHSWYIVSENSSGFTVKEIINDIIINEVSWWFTDSTFKTTELKNDTSYFNIIKTDTLITFKYLYPGRGGYPRVHVNIPVYKYPVRDININDFGVFDSTSMLECSDGWDGNGWSTTQSFKKK